MGLVDSAVQVVPVMGQVVVVVESVVAQEESEVVLVQEEPDRPETSVVEPEVVVVVVEKPLEELAVPAEVVMSYSFGVTFKNKLCFIFGF